jgi:peptidoglycan-associated lipoprotein
MNFKLLTVLLGAAILTGCASHEKTLNKFATVNQKIQKMDEVDARTDSKLTKEVQRLDEKVAAEVKKIEAKLAAEIKKVEDKLAAEVKKIETVHATDLAKTNEQIKETLRIAMGKFVFAPAGTEKTVLFDINSVTVSKADKEVLSEMAKALTTANKNVLVEIKGFTDRKVTEYQNQVLAQRRAEAVRMFLNEEGVALNRMAAIAQPNQAEEKTSADAASNRRVTITIVQ